MRAAAVHTVAVSLVLTALAAAPSGGAPRASDGPGVHAVPEVPGGAAESRGTAVAAARARVAGVGFGACPGGGDMPAVMKCGTVSVPLDYARPDGPQIRLTVSRAQAAGTRPPPGGGCRARAPSSSTRAGRAATACRSR